MINIEAKYADLLVNYCLELKPDQRIFIQSSTLAEPLVREVYREAIKVGALPEVSLEFREKNRIFVAHANDTQLDDVSPIREHIIKNFDAFLSIRAPYNLKEEGSLDPHKRKKRAQVGNALHQIFAQRTAEGSLTRSICQYPTNASAQEAGMSLEEYQEFVYQACHLYADHPAQEWLKIRNEQQRIVDFLNRCKTINFKNGNSDITFSVDGRTWINSDGRVNMPSGEVFTGPVEDSVNGTVHFDYPSIYQGQEVRGVTLEVKHGEVKKWSAEQGQDVLDQVMSVKGARYFGEVAIGTNYNIQRPTKNILFDEKIGGSIHMAVGQSYIQTGGKNQSVIHWDLISNMKEGGQIIADDTIIYEDGAFII